MPVIQFQNVSKSFPHAAERMLLRGHIVRWFSRKRTEPFLALNDVSFEVNEGETLGVVGHNGAGKSTLLSLVAGVAVPSSGRVQVSGRIAALLELGSGFHPDLTGAENLILNASLLGMNRRETMAKYDQIVDFAGIGSSIDEPMRTYSTGMTMRLAFAVAIHADPRIVILDEVLAVGDAEFQAKCRKAIDEMRAERRTFLLVSHANADVRRMCDRVIWLDHGQLVKQGPTEDVLEAYEAGRK